jgi:hypothetical protein
MNFIEKIARRKRKKKEFAPGLPRREQTTNPPVTEKPKIWASVIQRHDARRAGTHFDFRLGDLETGIGHSWAMRKLPGPGEKVLAIQQPDHTIPYFKFTGEIPVGYGAGEVGRHSLLDAEVLESDKNRVIFNRYDGRDTHEYVLRRMDDKHWLLINRTPTAKSEPMPESKPKYKEIKPGQVDPKAPGRWDAKIDGASLNYVIHDGKPIRAFSYRRSRRGPALIQHTQRIPTLQGEKAPKGYKRTILRGEVWATNPKTKKAIEARELGALLNSHVLRSRRLQESKGKLKNIIFDIVMHKGKNVEGLPTEEKRRLIDEVIKDSRFKGIFEKPSSATTPSAKMKLFEKIRKKQHKQTKEGVIIHSPEGVMTKVKFKPEWDVEISGIFTKPKSKAKGQAGGFTYRKLDGKRISRLSRVGTGFSRKLREAMYENPEDFVGVVAKVTGMEQYPSGAIRTPSFVGWHLDKNEPAMIPEIKK